MLRSSSILGIGLAVAALAAFQVTGCGDSGGGGNPGTGGSTGTAGTSASGVAGTTGSGGADSTGTAGTSSSGAAGSSTTGTGGTSATGTGGTSATGAGGTSATGAGGSAFGQPLCSGTVTKGGACTATDAPCFKTCGPGSKGVKSETCTNAVWVEMDGCSFDPSMDYSCYKIPTEANPMCPAADMPPQANTDCTVDMCKPCNTTGGLLGGMYKDSSGNAKVGLCVCQPPSASGRRTWTCASDTAWPCTATGGSPGCI